MKKFIIPGISIIILIWSCKKDPLPISAFTYDAGNNRVGTTIYFYNSSKYADSYEWNFGDGATSREVNPNHSYSAYGIYGVTLKAIGTGGDKITTDSLFILPVFYGISGIWLFDFTLNDKAYTGKLMLYQQYDNSIKGTFSWLDNSGSSTLLSPSNIEDDRILLELLIDGWRFSFEGTVNSFYDLISGLYYVGRQPYGTFTASRLLKK